MVPSTCYLDILLSSSTININVPSRHAILPCHLDVQINIPPGMPDRNRNLASRRVPLDMLIDVLIDALLNVLVDLLLDVHLDVLHLLG